jgi:hypothetical protein
LLGIVDEISMLADDVLDDEHMRDLRPMRKEQRQGEHRKPELPRALPERQRHVGGAPP